jgi:hypothetical protein
MESNESFQYWHDQRKIGFRLFLVFAVVVSLGVGFLVKNSIGPTPYMDEIFHIRQTQQYCLHGNWTHWDEKITTLPGLYVLTSGICNGISFLLQPLFNLTQHLIIERLLSPSVHGSPNNAIDMSPLSDGEEIGMNLRNETYIITIDEDHAEEIVNDTTNGRNMALLLLDMVKESIKEVISRKSPILLYLCSSSFIRLFINPVISIITMFIINDLLSIDNYAKETWKERYLKLCIIFSFPLSFFFNLLFYTDSGSLMFVIATLWAVERGYNRSSAILGFVAVFFRQTNVVWIAFVMVSHIIKRVYISTLVPLDFEAREEKRKQNKIGNRKSPPLGDSPSFSQYQYGDKSLFHDIITLAIPEIVQYGIKNFWKLLMEFGGHLSLMIGFLLFVKINGGITVGDRSAHEASTHLPQILYFLAFTSCFSFPLLLLLSNNSYIPLYHHFSNLFKHILLKISRKKKDDIKSSNLQPPSLQDPSSSSSSSSSQLIRHTISPISTFFSPTPTIFFTIAFFSAFAFYSVYFHTTAHPYLLADNRHYTFYIWKNFFMAIPIFKYMMIPFYLASFLLIISRLSASILPINLQNTNANYVRRKERVGREGELALREVETAPEEETEGKKATGSVRKRKKAGSNTPDLPAPPFFHTPSLHHRHLAFSSLWISSFFIFTAITLVPSPLLEFRYFIIPFSIFSIQTLKSQLSSPSLLLQLSLNIVINAATLYLFLFRPFQWENPQEPVARFIW